MAKQYQDHETTALGCSYILTPPFFFLLVRHFCLVVVSMSGRATGPKDGFEGDSDNNIGLIC